MLPLFPLSTVLLPGTSLPLHIVEPRFRQLVADLITGRMPERLLGIVTVHPDREHDTTVEQTVDDIGCAAVLEDVISGSDGRFDVVITGRDRFVLRGIVSSDTPYPVATVDRLVDTTPSVEDARLLPALVPAAKDAHRRYRERLWAGQEPEPVDTDAPIGALAYLLAADCLLSTQDRHALLAELCPAGRLRLLRQLLNREIEILRVLRAVPMPLTEIVEFPGRN
jgi:Lon protease-like protein